MNTIRYNSLAFGGSDRKRIDVQGHTGQMHDGMKNMDRTYSGQNIMDTVSDFNVKKVLVSSLSGLNSKDSNLFKDELTANIELLEECRNSGGILYPLASCQPGITSDTNGIEKVLSKGKFYGMKFHPTNTGQSIKDNFDIYSKYLSVAEKYGLPCVFHSITDGKSDPEQIIKLAEKHKRLPVILYHIDLVGDKNQFEKTINSISQSVKDGKSNLFVDLSWLTDIWPENTQKNKDIIKMAIDKLGVERILFGSDTPITEMGDRNLYGKFVDFIETTTKEYFRENGKEDEAEKALNKIFYDNAEEIFFTKNWNKSKFSKPAKIAALCFAGAAVLIGGGYFLNKELKENAHKKELTKNPSRVLKNTGFSTLI